MEWMTELELSIINYRIRWRRIRDQIEHTTMWPSDARRPSDALPWVLPGHQVSPIAPIACILMINMYALIFVAPTAHMILD